MQDIKYCTTITRKSSYDPGILIDDMGKVCVLGSTANGEGFVPTFDAQIIDVEYQTALCVALDKNGKVYQWGKLPYKCTGVPKDLPKIKQITTSHSRTVIALDEVGKLHWWGGHESDHIFLGDYCYKDQWKIMPDIKSKIVQVVAECNIVVALDEYGKVYSWGYYIEGRCSHKKIHDIPSDLPVIKKIELRWEDSIMALDENGKVHSWGNDYDGCPVIPNNLPFIVDIAFLSRTGIPLALDESGKVHILAISKFNLKNNSTYIENLKKLPKLKYLNAVGGIDEFGNLYNVDRINERIKVMLPYR